MELRDIVADAMDPRSENFSVLKQHGLIRTSVTQDQLADERVRRLQVETALLRFAQRQADERAQILKDLHTDATSDLSISTRDLANIRPSPERFSAYLEERAREIWTSATRVIRERAEELTDRLERVSKTIDNRQYDQAQGALEAASKDLVRIDEMMMDATNDAKRELRRDFNNTHGRVWSAETTRQFDTFVNRSVFLPPEEYRKAATSLTDERQRLSHEMSFVSEQQKRLEKSFQADRQPSQAPSPKF